MADVDLIVIGAGLSGCGLIARLRQLGWDGRCAIVEAGRGPGGRTATRRRRENPDWLLDHGAPAFDLQAPITSGLSELIAPLINQGVLVQDRCDVVCIEPEGTLTHLPPEAAPEGGWWRGQPCMASICEQLLRQAEDSKLEQIFQQRIRWIDRHGGIWTVANQDRSFQLSGRTLVLSGSLLAHPRSLAMLNWEGVPLRQADPRGADPALNEALDVIAQSKAQVRWNLMLDVPLNSSQLPRQIWLNAEARSHWQIERIVLHPQVNGRTGLVVHGLHNGAPITPETQPNQIEEQTIRLNGALDSLLNEWPELQSACRNATQLGVMRWGASQPMDHPLPQHLQWCVESRVGFCGDYVGGPGFGRAQGALNSAVELATRIVAE